MAKVTAPRGMRDILPGEKRLREWALGIIREVYLEHGFDEIETPALENYDRLHAGLGGDNEKLSFSVLKRGLKEEDLALAAENLDIEKIADLGLRFDLTVPLTRYYASNRAQLPDVLRAIQIGPVWRAERPQKGRYRQFVQADIDILGDSSLVAEAELITATSGALTKLGLRGCTIRLNDRRILNAMLDAAGFQAADHARVLISVDKLDKIGLSGVTTELAEIDETAAKKLETALAAQEAAFLKGVIPLTREAMLAILPEGIDETGVASLEELGEAVKETLPEGVTISFDPTLVRGMGYYTGTIFEIAHPESGSSVGGGGRYDGMIGRFLGQDVPAVGFSIGFERIIDLIEAPEATVTKTALVYDAEVQVQTLMRLKEELRATGHAVVLTKKQKNMRAQIERLGAAGVGSFAQVSQGVSTIGELDIRNITVE